VLAAKHFLGFRRVYLLLERVERLGQIGRHVFAALRPLEKDADVIDLLGEAIAELEVFGEPPLAL
jgi:hypothetical protein